MATVKLYTLAGAISTKRVDFTQVSGDSGTFLLASGAHFLHQLTIDNTAGTTDVYLKLWAASSVTLGTTAPTYIFPCPAGESIEFSTSPKGAGATAMRAQVSKDAGTGTSSPALPTWTVTCALLLST